MNRRINSKQLPDGGHCPGCGGPLEIVHRHALDRFVSVFRSVHRYRCIDPQCGWQGLVGREDTATALTNALAKAMTWRSRLMWLLVGAALAMTGMATVLFGEKPRAAPQRLAAVSPDGAPQEGSLDRDELQLIPGLQYQGTELPPADLRATRNTTPLQLRHNCVWGVPGRTPYRGTVEQALTATQMLPPEVVQRISQMVENGWTRERVEISRTAIRSMDGRRFFQPRIPAMGFGDTVCFDTQVNFPPGHVEYAALYEAADRSGKTYSVMVPFVCNNVSVLGARAERGVPPPNNQVPEPASWLIACTALGVLAWLRSRRHREQA